MFLYNKIEKCKTQCLVHGEHSVDDRCDDRDGGDDSFYYDYAFLVSQREQMTQQTGGPPMGCYRLSVRMAQAGTLGARQVITVTGHPHTWCLPPGDSSAGCPAQHSAPEFPSPPPCKGPNFLGPPLQVPQHGAPWSCPQLQLYHRRWLVGMHAPTYTHACSLAPSTCVPN